MLDGYEKEVKRLKEHISRLSWYMRCGVTYPEMMAMSLKDIANFAPPVLSPESKSVRYIPIVGRTIYDWQDAFKEE